MLDLAKLVGLCFAMPIGLALLVSGQFRNRRALWLSVAAVGAVLLNFIAVGVVPPLLPQPAILDGTHWNWLGKVCTIVATMSVYAALSRPLKAEAGLFALPRPPEWGSVIAVSVATLAFFWWAAFASNASGNFGASRETLLFQALLPGIDEETAFRGTILALLIGAFGKPWRVAGINIGWGALPVIAFFGLAHGYGAVAGGGAIDWTIVAITGVMGASLLWLKERTGSVLVPIIVHNAANVGSVWLGGS